MPSHSRSLPLPDAMPANFAFDNSYARDLPGLYVAWQPATVPAPELLFLNRDAGRTSWAWTPPRWTGPEGAALFAGNRVPEGAAPLAQAYAGHQFGGFSPQLGDGRALLLGEVIDRARPAPRHRASRARAARRSRAAATARPPSGPMLREVLIGEAMHALGIPTTRALAVVATGEPVLPRSGRCPARCSRAWRPATCAWAPSSSSPRAANSSALRQLADYAIARHDPALAGTPSRYLALLRAVAAAPGAR